MHPPPPPMHALHAHVHPLRCMACVWHVRFQVVRSSQLTRLARAAERDERRRRRGDGAATAADEQIPCFHCRQLEPLDDRQPLTSRTAALTRRAGEALAAAAGDDVGEGSGVWWRLATQVAPQQLRSLARIYRRMPKRGPFKLRLL